MLFSPDRSLLACNNNLALEGVAEIAFEAGVGGSGEVSRLVELPPTCARVAACTMGLIALKA